MDSVTSARSSLPVATTDSLQRVRRSAQGW